MKDLWKVGIMGAIAMGSALMAQSSASHTITIRIRYPNVVMVQPTTETFSVQPQGNTQWIFQWKTGEADRRVTVSSEAIQGKLIIGKDRIVMFHQEARDLFSISAREGQVPLRIIPDPSRQVTAGRMIYTITAS